MSLLSLMSVFTEIAYKWWTFLLLFSIIPLPSQLLNACKRSGKMVRNKLLSVIPSNPFQRLWRRWGDEWIKDFPNSKKRRIKKKWEGLSSPNPSYILTKRRKGGIETEERELISWDFIVGFSFPFPCPSYHIFRIWMDKIWERLRLRNSSPFATSHTIISPFLSFLFLSSLYHLFLHSFISWRSMIERDRKGKEWHVRSLPTPFSVVSSLVIDWKNPDMR